MRKKRSERPSGQREREGERGRERERERPESSVGISSYVVAAVVVLSQWRMDAAARVLERGQNRKSRAKEERGLHRNSICICAIYSCSLFRAIHYVNERGLAAWLRQRVSPWPPLSLSLSFYVSLCAWCSYIIRPAESEEAPFGTGLSHYEKGKQAGRQARMK